MILAVMFLVLVAVLAFVGYPLLRPLVSSPDITSARATRKLEHLFSDRESILAMLKDLELEHGIGNLSTGDYAALRDAARHRAVTILSELDKLTTFELEPSLERTIESEIACARQVLALQVAARALGDELPLLTHPAAHDSDRVNSI